MFAVEIREDAANIILHNQQEEKRGECGRLETLWETKYIKDYA